VIEHFSVEYKQTEVGLCKQVIFSLALHSLDVQIHSIGLEDRDLSLLCFNFMEEV